MASVEQKEQHKRSVIYPEKFRTEHATKMNLAQQSGHWVDGSGKKNAAGITGNTTPTQRPGWSTSASRQQSFEHWALQKII